MNILTWILIIIGIWQMIFSLLLDAKNVQSKIVFKIIPFFSGMYCIFYALIQSGVLIITK